MKTIAFMAEDGRKIDASSEDDWALVYKTGRRLFCPSHADESCPSELKAVQRPSRKRTGTVTRFFAFKSGRCGHAEVKSGIEVSLRPGGESAEHLWLKQFVLDSARKCGYEADAEYRLESGVRADVWVHSACRGRIEVQRVPTDVSERTKQDEQVVWLLREDAMTKAMTSILFRNPCVQVRVTEKVDTPAGTDWVAAKPWETDRTPVLSVRATATVLAKLDTPQPHRARKSGKRNSVKYFQSESMRLHTFLDEVWSGKRRWYPKGSPHYIAGWILVEEYEQHRSEIVERRRRRQRLTQQKAQQRADSAAQRASVEPEVPPIETPARESSSSEVCSADVPLDQPSPEPQDPPSTTRLEQTSHTPDGSQQNCDDSDHDLSAKSAAGRIHSYGLGGSARSSWWRRISRWFDIRYGR